MDIKVKNLSHEYHAGSPFATTAIEDLNLTIPSGAFVSIIGHTGSGKSTFIQHLNGLIKPTSGSITIGPHQLTSDMKKKGLKALRQQVGMVFQYPEHQLFEETVEKDICFGPLNFGVPLEKAKERAREALALVKLPEEILARSPFELSGGQMRRVAIAGILAIDPEVLVLDEPTAGLDPSGHRDMMALFSRLHEERGLTTVMVTHDMDDAAYYSDEVIVMDHGRVVMKGSPETVFSETETIRDLGLDVPVATSFLLRLNEKFGETAAEPVFSIDQAAKRVSELLKKGRDHS